MQKSTLRAGWALVRKMQHRQENRAPRGTRPHMQYESFVGTIGKRVRDVFRDKQQKSIRPTGPPSAERFAEVSPEVEAALDQLSARLERLKQQAERLAASLAPKRK